MTIKFISHGNGKYTTNDNVYTILHEGKPWNVYTNDSLISSHSTLKAAKAFIIDDGGYVNHKQIHGKDVFNNWNDTDIVYLDTETTGLYNSEVISIGIVDKYGNKLFYRLVNPIKQIEAGASNVHGYTNDMLKDKPSIDAVWDELCELLSTKVVAGYNIMFDIRALENTANLHGLKMPSIKYVDVMDYSMVVFGRRVKLTQFASTYGISNNGSHNALNDARMTQQIFHKLYSEYNMGGISARSLSYNKSNDENSPSLSSFYLFVAFIVMLLVIIA